MQVRIGKAREVDPSVLWSGSGLILLAAVVMGLLVLELAVGSPSIPIREVMGSLLGQSTSYPIWDQIIHEVRLPRGLAAILGGACLALSGLEMQTLFRNPLAGPFSLGISSGATLGVALALLVVHGISGTETFSFFQAAQGIWSEMGIAMSAIVGSSLVMVGVMALSRRIRNNTTLLILGLMFGQVASALVSVLQVFSPADRIRAFTFWTFGSFTGVAWGQMPVFAGAAIIGFALSAVSAKSLNALLLGENYALSLGVPLQFLRLSLLAGASILAGVTTAFCGPVAFLGLAVPHLCRSLFRTSDHRWLVPASVLMGAGLALLSDLAAGLPGSDRALPLNSITALIGAPVVIWVLLRRRPGSSSPP
jgi:iron complex transport system permease protein